MTNGDKSQSAMCQSKTEKLNKLEFFNTHFNATNKKEKWRVSKWNQRDDGMANEMREWPLSIMPLWISVMSDQTQINSESRLYGLL